MVLHVLLMKSSNPQWRQTQPCGDSGNPHCSSVWIRWRMSLVGMISVISTRPYSTKSSNM